MKKVKIAVITGSRSEYGILSPIMKKIKSRPQLQLLTIVVGMHLSSEFGRTVREIEKDSFKIDAKINSIDSGDTNVDMVRHIGKGIIKTADVFKNLKPDIVILLGDRVDILAAAIAAAYMNIAIAHIHGGDVSGGGLDEPARHAITKFAHIHFAATKKSAQRLIKMGEEPWRVFVVGAPGLDSILNERLLSKENISKKYNLDLSKPILLVVQHPLTTQPDNAAQQMGETLKAIVELKYQTILIYPNADAGGRRMIQIIKKYQKHSFIKTFKSIPHKDYLSLMKISNVMIGNSSSGIIESSSFKLPVVNIGTRQKGRERSTNVIDVNYNKGQILRAIKKALYDKRFKKQVKNCKNSYGDGHASDRIIKVLSEIRIDKKLLQKRMPY